MKINIRNEETADWREVEELVREAFWNLYVPGANEHLIVHKLRGRPEFIPELDFVAVFDGRIVGQIIFSRSSVHDSAGIIHDTITFGPVSVLPELQNRGIGDALIRHALHAAGAYGYSAVIIFGYPGYYKRFGFKPAKEWGITGPEGKFYAAHQVQELQTNALAKVWGEFRQSDAFDPDESELVEFEQEFPEKEKKVTESQASFAAMCETYL